MSPARRFRRTAILPVAITLASLWLLIGCLYIPTPQRLRLTGSKKDFRPLVSYEDTHKVIVPRRISRAAVEALLGPPPFESVNRRRLLYVIHLKKGIWIMPLCFTVISNEDKAVGLLLNFDDRGMLEYWEQIEATGGARYGPGASGETEKSAETRLVNQLDNPSSAAASRPASDEWRLKSTRY